MEIRVESHHLEGAVWVLLPGRFQDERGFFSETYRDDQFRALGLKEAFVQDNHSGSVRGVLRGLHFQWEPPMGKIMRVTRGEAFLVSVDIRKGSPTLGQWFGIRVSDESRRLIWAPAGFARGFLVLSEYAEVEYKCTAIYNSQCDSAIRWDDPAIGISWPLEKDVLLSRKDREAPTLEQWLTRPEANRFRY